MHSLGLRIIFLFRIRSGSSSRLKRGIITIIIIISIIIIILGLKKNYLDKHLSPAAGCATHRPLSGYFNLRVVGNKILQLLLLIM